MTRQITRADRRVISEQRAPKRNQNSKGEKHMQPNRNRSQGKHRSAAVPAAETLEGQKSPEAPRSLITAMFSPSFMKYALSCLLALILTAGPSTLAAEGPAELLQKGLFEEEANHNL
jgi:hypothetical protein